MPPRGGHIGPPLRGPAYVRHARKHQLHGALVKCNATKTRNRTNLILSYVRTFVATEFMDSFYNRACVHPSCCCSQSSSSFRTYFTHRSPASAISSCPLAAHPAHSMPLPMSP